MEYLDSLKAGCIVQAHTWVKLSDMPSELTDGLMSVVFIADKGNRNYDYVIVNKNGDQWLAYPNGNTTGNRTLNWVKQPTRAEMNALKNTLSPTLSGCGSGSSIHAVQIGTVVAVTAKIEYSGTSNMAISGLPNHNGDTQNGFVVTARDQTDGSIVRMWTNGGKNIMKYDNLTEGHMYGLSYTYITA